MAELTLAQLKQQAQQIAAEQARAQKQIEEIERQQREQELFAQRSAVEVCYWLKTYIDYKIETGKLTETDCTNYFTRLKETYGNQKTLEAYVRVVVKLLCHKYQGVESTTHRLGNGGLIFKGKTYETVIALYKEFVDLLGGDPWDHISWFLDLLDLAIKDEKLELVTNVDIPDRLTTTTNRLKVLVAYEKSLVKTPDESKLTPEDMLFIMTVVGAI